MQTPESDLTALDLAAIAVRVRQMVNTTKLDGTEFAVRIGVPYGTMRAYLSGQRAPSAEFLIGCYRAFGFRPSWLLAGDAPMSLAGGEGADEEDSGMVSIPRYRVSASAGPGVVAEDVAEYKVGAVAVSRAWLRQRRLSPAGLRAIEVRGTSMQPVLADGDMVIMDMTDREPRTGFIYVLRRGDELLVKYVERLGGGSLRVSSANAAFTPYEIDLQKDTDVAILGRVVTSMHDW